MGEKKSIAFNLTLKSSEEIQLRTVFKMYSDLDNHISLQQFLKFCFEKSLISNQSPMNSMLSVFLQAAGDKPYLNRARFFYSINLLGRLLFPDEILPLDPILTCLLSADSTSHLKSFPIFDSTTNLLFTESILHLFCKTEPGFLNILSTYNSENIKKGRKIKGIQEIKTKNLGINPRNLVRYLKLKDTVFPSLISIEDFQKIIEEVVPAKDSTTRKYFSYGYMLRFYYKEEKITTLTRIKDLYGEPELRLTELQLVFGRLAMRVFSEVEDSYARVYQLLHEKLALTTEKELPVKYCIEEDPYILFGELGKPKEILTQYEKAQITQVKTPKESFDIASIIGNVPVMPSMEEIEKHFDFDRVPQIAEIHSVVVENPPPYVLPPVLHPLKGNVLVGEANPLISEKKGVRPETPNAKVKFAEMPGQFHSQSPEKSRYESFEKIRRNLNMNLVPETMHHMLSNPIATPSLIKEILNLPNCPPLVAGTIESCYMYQGKGQLKNALLSIMKAKSEYSKLEPSKKPKPEPEIFFEMTKASIFESAGKYKLALAHYFEYKSLFESLAFSHPDKALFFCGVGFSLYHLGEIRMATRSFLMAKRIRERCIGGDTIESATIYNNLGVCMFGLERFQEAFGFFQLSEAIFLSMFGPNNARSITVVQNINRVKRQNLIPSPDFKTLWAKQFLDPFANVKKKKEKTKKKKKN